MSRLNRMLAIRANAAGPYKVSGPCHDCGETEGLVAMPLPFAVSIAICRRCRFNRTGIPDRRNLVQGEASIAYERKVAKTLTAPPPVKIAGLLPAICESSFADVDDVFRPWTDDDDEKRD